MRSDAEVEGFNPEMKISSPYSNRADRHGALLPYAVPSARFQPVVSRCATWVLARGLLFHRVNPGYSPSGGREEENTMVEKKKRSVTVPLTEKQKQQIKRATGKSISALKVGPSGGMVAARRIQILNPNQ